MFPLQGLRMWMLPTVLLQQNWKNSFRPSFNE